MYFAKRDKNEIQQNINVFNYEWRDYFIISLIYILYIFFIWHKLFGVKNSKTALKFQQSTQISGILCLCQILLYNIIWDLQNIEELKRSLQIGIW